MFEKVTEYVKNTQWVQFLLVLVAGVAIGAIFYPTKHIEERERQKHELETKSLREVYQKDLSEVHDTLDKVSAQYNTYRSETDQKITKLTTENTTLKSRQKISYYKLVKPDGTIEVRKFTETEIDETKQVITSIQEEFKQKVESIESRWETIHKERVEAISKEYKSKEVEYKRQIDELEKSKVVDINPKRFGVEAGVLINKTFYGHVTYDVFGPVFLGLHSEFGGNTSANGGAGLGLRF